METIFKKNSINELNAQELEQIASFCSDEATFLLLKETFNHIESENNTRELPALSVKHNLDDLFVQTYPQNTIHFFIHIIYYITKKPLVLLALMRHCIQQQILSLIFYLQLFVHRLQLR